MNCPPNIKSYLLIKHGMHPGSEWLFVSDFDEYLKNHLSICCRDLTNRIKLHKRKNNLKLYLKNISQIKTSETCGRQNYTYVCCKNLTPNTFRGNLLSQTELHYLFIAGTKIRLV